MRVRISWRSVGLLAESESRPPNPSLFNEEPSGRIFRLLGIARQFQFDSHSLRPTASYFQQLNRRVKREIQDKKPLQLKLFDGVDASCSFPAHRVYSPAIGLVDTEITFAVSKSFDLYELFGARSLNTDKNSSVGIVTEEAFKCMSEYMGFVADAARFRGKPLFLIELDKEIGLPVEYIRFNRSELAGLLIGNRDYESMHSDITDNLFAASAELNKKTAETYMLASKQGIVVLGREGDVSRPAAGLYVRSCACFELATVCLTVLSEYPDLRQFDPESADRALLMVSYLVNHSQAIFNASYSTHELWKRLVADMSIRELMNLVMVSNRDAKDVLSRVPPGSNSSA